MLVEAFPHPTSRLHPDSVTPGLHSRAKPPLPASSQAHLVPTSGDSGSAASTVCTWHLRAARENQEGLGILWMRSTPCPPRAHTKDGLRAPFGKIYSFKLIWGTFYSKHHDMPGLLAVSYSFIPSL